MPVSEALPYAESRRLFLRGASGAGWEVTTIGQPATQSAVADFGAPPTARLAIDIASRGPADAPHVLIVSAGLHGVEGLFGSQLLLDWFRATEGKAAENQGPLRMVAVHCLNPFGYAHRRRTDPRNIDLNRNFSLDGSRPEAVHPALADDLDRLLNPPELPRRPDWFRLGLWRLGARYGVRRVRQTIAEGQWRNSRGLFFGGHGPSSFAQWCEANWGKVVGSAQRVTHFDVHSGLGRYATLRLLLQPGLSDVGLERMRCSYGSLCVPPAPLPRSAVQPSADTRCGGPRRKDLGYQAQGTWGDWLQQRFDDRQYEYACAEFGTYGGMRVLAALRDENAAWHLTGPDSPDRLRAADRLQECFYPASMRWRIRVRAKFLALVARACAHTVWGRTG